MERHRLTNAHARDGSVAAAAHADAGQQSVVAWTHVAHEAVGGNAARCAVGRASCACNKPALVNATTQQLASVTNGLKVTSWHLFAHIA